MISLDEALYLIRSTLDPVDKETIPLTRAHGRTLAVPVIAARTQPPFAASAMDGYAVRSASLTGQSVSLRLSGESAAGRASPAPVGIGVAFRISTGAPMPVGADQVVIQENCSREGDNIITAEPSRPGANIRKVGVDFSTGDRLLDAGRKLSAAGLSLVASAGLSDVFVCRQPAVGLLSTGDELVEIGQTAGPDQIINSLGPGLTALVRKWGGQPRYLGIARDDPEDVREKLMAGNGLDLLVTIGGASVGDHDHLRKEFAVLGGELVFEKIAIKPGKPTWFGRLGPIPVIGLPGNPVSAMVMARLCLKAAMDRLLGSESPVLFPSAKLGMDLPANGPRENLIRAHYDVVSGQIAPLVNQDSSALSALVASNALIRRPANAAAARAGEGVTFLPLDMQ
ncbi:MAG: molybdopterin molybdenumtransferase MoeA [Rhodobacterales bacterium CG15_BIG_FIL_POST_REV_8_21_14_020_59_13]|nr:MAG: molybdopterin molybdenumtransferase MoeA [Rhodobacterales bacterium CG15_BIG_FIL_POST_REV_8_21_14_020_59_13]